MLHLLSLALCTYQNAFEIHLCYSCLFLLSAEQYFVVWMCDSLFIHVPVEYLCFFQFVMTINKTDLNIHIQVLC